MKPVLHSDDLNLLSHWEESLSGECVVFDDLEELLKLKQARIVLNYSACNNQCEDILTRLLANKNSVLVLHRVPTLTTAKQLLKLGAKGYGNAMMRGHFIVSALNTIQDEMVWLYPEFTSELIAELPSTNSNNEQHLQKLTEREREVALLLKDGQSYKVVAETLAITPRTVKAHAGQIYMKLNTKDRLGLALLLK